MKEPRIDPFWVTKYKSGPLNTAMLVTGCTLPSGPIVARWEVIALLLYVEQLASTLARTRNQSAIPS